jgi:hypothetical protein
MALFKRNASFATLALSACFAPAADAAAAPDEIAQPSVGVVTQFRAEWLSSLTFWIERPKYDVFRKKEDLKEFWDAAREQSPNVPAAIPDIDFSRFTLVIAAVGRRPDGGYSVVMSSYIETPERILLLVEDRQQSGDRCLAPQMVAYPIVFGLIPKTTKRVEFQVTTVMTACG